MPTLYWSIIFWDNGSLGPKSVVLVGLSGLSFLTFGLAFGFGGVLTTACGFAAASSAASNAASAASKLA